MDNNELYSVKPHHKDDETNESCKFGHSAFLFLEDVTNQYASDCENRVYFHCICLECGAYGDFCVSGLNKIIYTNTDSQNAFDSYYKVRSRYLKLRENNNNISNIVDTMNHEYRGKTKTK